MATFQNQATITYGGVTLASNIVTGEYTETLTVTKTPVVATYAAGGKITYIVSLVNAGTAALSGLTLTDDLGGYPAAGGTAYPLAYQDGSIRYFANGVLQPAPTVNAGPPMTITGIDVPAGGNAAVLYEAGVTGFAPLAADAFIENTVTVTGGGLVDPVTAQATVTVISAPQLSITKGISPDVVGPDGVLTYTFRIENCGNTAITDADDLVLNDVFDPILSDIAVTLNGAPMPTTDYTYTAGAFATVPGAITVPAATYAQDPDTGEITVTPGVAHLTISGTVG